MELRKIGIITVIFLLFACLRLDAWGPTSHMSMTRKALENSSDPMARDEELRKIILFTSTGPDFSGLGESYHVWHDPDFVEALQKVASTLEGREKDRLMAVSCGWMAHIQADNIGHQGSGYPNAKNLFPNLPRDQYLPSHISTEFSVGVLDYQKDPKFFEGIPCFMPPASQFMAAIETYRKIKETKGETDQSKFSYSKEQYGKDVSKFRLTLEGEKAVFRKILKDRPELIPQLEKKFADRDAGVKGVGGTTESVESVKAGFQALKNNKAIPGSPTLRDRFSHLDRNIKESIAHATIAGIGNVLVSVAADNSAIRKKVSESINAENSIYVKYIGDLVLEKNLDLDYILANAESGGNPVSAGDAELKTAQTEVEISRNRVENLQKKIDGRGLLTKISKFLFADNEAKELEAAKKELQMKESHLKEILEKVKTKVPGFSPFASGPSSKTEMIKTPDF